MDACEEYARLWAKNEDVEVDTLSEWIESIADLLTRRIGRLKRSVNTRHESIFCDPEVARELSRLKEKLVIVPADKASNNYSLQEGLCEHLDRRTCTSIASWKPYIQSYRFFCIRSAGQQQICSHFLWTRSKRRRTRFAIYLLDPKDAQNPYKHRFIAGSAKCSAKPLSILLTKLLTHIKQGLQKYCETAYSRSGVNQMWILKNSKELLGHLKSPNFNHTCITSFKSFDFSYLYTTLPQDRLQNRLASIIRNSFIFKNGNHRYKYLLFDHGETYFVKVQSDSKNKFSEDDIIKMLEFLVDNIFVVFAGKVFQQIVGIPIGTNCAPLLADIFLYSYEVEFIQS